MRPPHWDKLKSVEDSTIQFESGDELLVLTCMYCKWRIIVTNKWVPIHSQRSVVNFQPKLNETCTKIVCRLSYSIVVANLSRSTFLYLTFLKLIKHFIFFKTIHSYLLYVPWSMPQCSQTFLSTKHCNTMASYIDKPEMRSICDAF